MNAITNTTTFARNIAAEVWLRREAPKILDAASSFGYSALDLARIVRGASFDEAERQRQILLSEAQFEAELTDANVVATCDHWRVDENGRVVSDVVSAAEYEHVAGLSDAEFEAEFLAALA